MQLTIHEGLACEASSTDDRDECRCHHLLSKKIGASTSHKSILIHYQVGQKYIDSTTELHDYLPCIFYSTFLALSLVGHPFLSNNLHQ